MSCLVYLISFIVKHLNVETWVQIQWRSFSSATILGHSITFVLANFLKTWSKSFSNFFKIKKKKNLCGSQSCTMMVWLQSIPMILRVKNKLVLKKVRVKKVREYNDVKVLVLFFNWGSYVQEKKTIGWTFHKVVWWFFIGCLMFTFKNISLMMMHH
jgi:hypothetical protein